MQVRKVIERAEKQRSLGRFDEKSALSFLNDAIFEISKRQSLKIKETYYGYYGAPIRMKGVVIKHESIEILNPSRDYKHRVMPDGTVLLYIKPEELEYDSWREVDIEDGFEEDEIVFRYTGYKPVSKYDENINVPEEFETALVYYLRSKMFEERDELEMSQYFSNQFKLELLSKAHPKRDVVSKPSEFSLL